MKSNESPEKIYFPDSPVLDYILDFAKVSNRTSNDDIEYTRTDAFIEKALKWYCLDCICNDTCSNTCYFKSTFKKYLEGDDEQLPPKIENAINPDGSTTDNYRYRHFISRMQDAFIEKACDAYCKICDTKECEGVGECGWLNKFREAIKK